MTARKSVFTLGVAVVAALVFAGNQDRVVPKAAIKLNSVKVKPGAVVKGEVTVEFPEGYHGYQNPPSSDYQIPVSLVVDDKTLKFKVTYPKGEKKMAGGEEAAVYSGKVVFPITFTAPTKVGDKQIVVNVKYQICDEHSCLPPGSVVLKQSIKVAK